MLEVVVLGSGSRGNATLVRDGRSAILIDAGFSCRQLVARLEGVGQDPRRIEAILLTHEHVDHVQGLRVFRRRFGTPVFASEGTLGAAEKHLGGAKGGEAHVLRVGGTVTVGAFEATSFAIPHDAADPVGWVIEAQGVRIGHATDLGHVTRLTAHRLAGCHALVFEANHDRQLLMDGPYPWSTKQRVASRVGHLSNDAAAEALGEIVSDETRTLVLAHLSENNNDPGLAQATIHGALAEAGRRPEVVLATQAAPAAPVTL